MGNFRYKVLLPTSGTGSRLGEITKNVNKSLIPLNGKATICYIIDSYPDTVSIVVTLGYLGQSVKDFLEKKYPQRIFEFVWVDKFEGKGSSLGYSMLQAKKNLQCPFVFHACDGIFIEKIPAPDHNWIGGYVENWETSKLPLEQYTTHIIKNGKIVRINDRGITKFDSVHIGLDGIYDYQIYWQTLETIYNLDPNNTQISDVIILNKIMSGGVEFSLQTFKVWLDTGNIEALEDTKKFLLNKK